MGNDLLPVGWLAPGARYLRALDDLLVDLVTLSGSLDLQYWFVSFCSPS